MLDHTIKISAGGSFNFYFRFTSNEEAEVIDEDANVYTFERTKITYEKVDQFLDDQIVKLYCFDTLIDKECKDHIELITQIKDRVNKILCLE